MLEVARFSEDHEAMEKSGDQIENGFKLGERVVVSKRFTVKFDDLPGTRKDVCVGETLQIVGCQMKGDRMLPVVHVEKQVDGRRLEKDVLIDVDKIKTIEENDENTSQAFNRGKWSALAQHTPHKFLARSQFRSVLFL